MPISGLNRWWTRFPILFALMIFSHLINYYSSIDMYFTYLYCLSLTVLCAQSFGHLSGIIFSDNTTVAVFVSVAFYLVSSNLSNIFIPLNDFHYVFKAISNLSFLKHSINCILLKIYGFGRCSEDQFSLILYKYNISDDIYTESLLNSYIHFNFSEVSDLVHSHIEIKLIVFE